MGRTLVWSDQRTFRGWGCSQCAWVFNPSGPPIGETVEAMKIHFQATRDKEFGAHVCIPRPRKSDANPDCN